jgi:hypothetical protein
VKREIFRVGCEHFVKQRSVVEARTWFGERRERNFESTAGMHKVALSRFA